MPVIIRLQRLPLAASAADIRALFHGLNIPEGGVHIVGGRDGDAFIGFATDEDARQAMRRDGKRILDEKIKLLLSSQLEMDGVIAEARREYTAAPAAAATAAVAASYRGSSERRRSRTPSPPPPVTGYSSYSSRQRTRVDAVQQPLQQRSAVAQYGNEVPPYQAASKGYGFGHEQPPVADESWKRQGLEQQPPRRPAPPLPSQQPPVYTAPYTGDRNDYSSPWASRPGSGAPQAASMVPPQQTMDRPFASAYNNDSRKPLDSDSRPSYRDAWNEGGWEGAAGDGARVATHLDHDSRPADRSRLFDRRPPPPDRPIYDQGAPTLPHDAANAFGGPPSTQRSTAIAFAPTDEDGRLEPKSAVGPMGKQSRVGMRAQGLLPLPPQALPPPPSSSQDRSVEREAAAPESVHWPAPTGAFGGGALPLRPPIPPPGMPPFPPPFMPPPGFILPHFGEHAAAAPYNMPTQSTVPPPHADSSSCCVIVSRLPPELTLYTSLRAFFSPLDLRNDVIKLQRDSSGAPLGTAYIRLRNEHECAEALRRDGEQGIRVRPVAAFDFANAVDRAPSNGAAPGPLPPLPFDHPAIPKAFGPGTRGRFGLQLYNIAYKVRERDIARFIAPLTPVRIQKAFEPEGFPSEKWFIEFAVLDDAEAAVAMDGKGEILGRTVKIRRVTIEEMDEALQVPDRSWERDQQRANAKRPAATPADNRRERHARSRSPNGRHRDSPSSGRSRSTRSPPPAKAGRVSSDVCVKLTGLPTTVTERDVSIFLEGVRLASNGVRLMKEPLGTAFVECASVGDCERALRRDRCYLGSQKVGVAAVSRADMHAAVQRQFASSFEPAVASPPAPAAPSAPAAATAARSIDPAVIRSIGTPGTVVAVHCLPTSITLEDLCQFFDGFELLEESVRMHYNNDGQPTGDCLLAVSSAADAVAAVAALDGRTLDGSIVHMYVPTA